MPGVPVVPLVREAARVLLLDPTDRLLLLRGADPVAPAAGTWWYTPGGGLEAGEDLAAAARREVHEELGVVLGTVSPPVWRRVAEFELAGAWVRQSERFVVARVDPGQVRLSTDTGLDLVTNLELRWWTPAELAATAEVVYPTRLAHLLPPLLVRARAEDWPVSPESVGP